MSYKKCGLFLQNLEVIKPAFGGPTCVVLSGKSVPSSVLNRLCANISRVSTNALFLITKSVKEKNSCFVNVQRRLPYECQDPKETHKDLTSHAEEKFQWADELPIIVEEKAPTYEPRPKLQRQFSRTDGCRY